MIIHELKEDYSKTIIQLSVYMSKEFLGNFYRDGKVYCTQTVKVYDHNFNTFSDGVGSNSRRHYMFKEDL